MHKVIPVDQNVDEDSKCLVWILGIKGYPRENCDWNASQKSKKHSVRQLTFIYQAYEKTL